MHFKCHWAWLLLRNLPQMLSGASSSKSIGCCKNISRDFKHKPRTSCSVICTAFPGRHFFTEMKNSIYNAFTTVCVHEIYDSTWSKVSEFWIRNLISHANCILRNCLYRKKNVRVVIGGIEICYFIHGEWNSEQDMCWCFTWDRASNWNSITKNGLREEIDLFSLFMMGQSA